MKLTAFLLLIAGAQVAAIPPGSCSNPYDLTCDSSDEDANSTCSIDDAPVATIEERRTTPERVRGPPRAALLGNSRKNNRTPTNYS